MRQLFNSFDPSPFIEKDLDDNAETYIVQSVSEFPLSTPLKLVIYLHQEGQSEAKKILPEAIHNYFDYRRQIAEKSLRSILRQGRTSMIIGLIFLFCCISLSEIINVLGDGMLVRIFREGLLIVGWVAMWRPLEIFLYDWWPISHSQNIFAKLACMEIDIRDR